MFYSMWKRRKLIKILKKRHSKRKSKKPCIVYLSCPELDAITGPPRREPGVIILHPIRALQLIDKGMEKAKKMRDRKTQRKLIRHREHVQTILHLLETHFKMGRQNMQDLGGEKRAQRNI